MKLSSKAVITFAICFLSLSASECFATTYTFTVRCPDSSLVYEWGVGDIDPGKEYLRGVTGTKFPGCSVGDYTDADSYLPKERVSHEAAVIQGVPLIGPIFCGIFGC